MFVFDDDTNRYTGIIGKEPAMYHLKGSEVVLEELDENLLDNLRRTISKERLRWGFNNFRRHGNVENSEQISLDYLIDMEKKVSELLKQKEK